MKQKSLSIKTNTALCLVQSKQLISITDYILNARALSVPENLWLNDLVIWAVKNNIPPAIENKIAKFKQNITNFKVAYQYPNAYRTSNLLDRLMVRMDHRLFDSQYFHGT